MVKKPPVYQQVKLYLRQMISRMSPCSNMFESEPVLTRKLSVSRETVRKAMADLKQEGLISKRHGKGSYGHPAVASLPMRFDLNSNFRLLLERNGYSVRSIRSEWTAGALPEEKLKRLPLSRGSSFIHFSQNLYADGKLAIISEVSIDTAHLLVYPAAGEYQDNIKDFFLNHCDTGSSYVIAWPKAEVRPEIARAFFINPETPLLCWDEAYHNIHDEGMGIIKVYFHPEIMDLSMLLHFT